VCPGSIVSSGSPGGLEDEDEDEDEDDDERTLIWDPLSTKVNKVLAEF
jgi:hypothetical protein